MKKVLKRGTGALREIRKYQKSTNLLIPKAAVGRFVKELCQVARPGGPGIFAEGSAVKDLRWNKTALYALQVSAWNQAAPTTPV